MCFYDKVRIALKGESETMAKQKFEASVNFSVLHTSQL